MQKSVDKGILAWYYVLTRNEGGDNMKYVVYDENNRIYQLTNDKRYAIKLSAEIGGFWVKY